MKTIRNKVLLVLILLFTALPLFAFNAKADCNDPTDPQYTTTACVNERLGLGSINPQAVFIPRDPGSFIVVGFRILLSVAVLLTIARIVIAGIKVAGAAEDADKRKEQFKTVMYSLVGMVIALGALGLTYVVQNVFYGDTFNDRIVNCTEIPATAPQTVKDRCAKYVTQ